ncbi:4'-phosphopantetheinyl transferase family protein [Herbaspirillum robiniae]|uniref:Phosphopantetheinyl transferase n=1 Tax=Herbaspirillum robiniae TaxID=2014887 RepID=A0A246WQT1_9BURK|nr:4'-phosphopantetheinyl transferase superfamily protein [Herbaspirillum robiniae]OWY28766.1 phosphopantetheinyl transferase [Herbaspirillum robiniae]
MPATFVWIVDGRDFLAASAAIPAIAPEFAAALSDGERARLQRFLKPQRAREFLLGRLLLRHALVQSLDCRMADIAVTERPGASPHVEVKGRPANGVALPGFSISHSRGWLACAVGEVFPLGVDIEAPAPQRDLRALAGLAFSPRESAWLAGQEATGQAGHEEAFYRLWCAKEALYKFRHNAGMRDMQGFPEISCGEGGEDLALGAPDAFLRHEAGDGYHLCLCSGARPRTHASERLDCARLLNLS